MGQEQSTIGHGGGHGPHPHAGGGASHSRAFPNVAHSHHHRGFIPTNPPVPPPQEPRHNVFRLQMNIDSADGRISGNVVLGDRQRAAGQSQTQFMNSFQHGHNHHHNHIGIGLPSERERREMIASFLANTNTRHMLSHRDVKNIADATLNWTRVQIENLCKNAANIPRMEVPNPMIREVFPSSVRPVNVNDFRQVLSMGSYPPYVGHSYYAASSCTLETESTSMDVSSDSSHGSTGYEFPSRSTHIAPANHSFLRRSGQ